MRRNKQHRILALVLVLPMLLVYAIAAASEISLSMNWKAGPPTKHFVSYQLGNKILLEKGNGEKQNIDQNVTYEGTYTQTISDHEKGLLVSFSDVEITAADPGFGDLKPSDMQLAIVKLTALTLVARPDYIVSTNGDFIELHNFEQFATAQMTRMKDLVPMPDNEFGAQFADFTDQAFNQTTMEEQIRHELSQLKELDKLTLEINKPINIPISPVYTTKHTSNDKAGVKIDSKLNYNGTTECQWKTTTTCADIRFSMDDENTYDVRMVIEPDTLTLHSYQANTDVNLEEDVQGSMMKANITYKYVHSVELK